MANFIMGIISLSVGVVVLAGVFITTVKAQNTTGWAASETALTGAKDIPSPEVVGFVEHCRYRWFSLRNFKRFRTRIEVVN